MWLQSNWIHSTVEAFSSIARMKEKHPITNTICSAAFAAISLLFGGKIASWKSHCQWKCRCICWKLKRITGIATATATKDLKSNGKAKRSRICVRASTGKSITKKPRTKITAVTWSENGWKFGAYSIQIVRSPSQCVCVCMGASVYVQMEIQLQA